MYAHKRPSFFNEHLAAPFCARLIASPFSHDDAQPKHADATVGPRCLALPPFIFFFENGNYCSELMTYLCIPMHGFRTGDNSLCALEIRQFCVPTSYLYEDILTQNFSWPI